MSHQAVRDFFAVISKSTEKQEMYKKLTAAWFGFSRSQGKIVELACIMGFHFTEEELKFVRLTNTIQEIKESMGSIAKKTAVDAVDLAPTAHPRPPECPSSFRAVNGRDPG